MPESAAGLIESFLGEVMRDVHCYRPGIEHRRPAKVNIPISAGRRLLRLGREGSRDLLERTALRAGFSRRHFDPAYAAARLAGLLAQSEQLAAALARLSDQASRQVFLDLLRLRVLGPYHAPSPIVPADYRAQQTYVDRHLRIQPATFRVSDPWFSPTSLYRAGANGHADIRLHCHSVDLVSVFLREQYSYRIDNHRVAVEPGDVVADIGGCWGDTALYFSALADPAGTIYTFEFDPESLQILRANLALNPTLAGRIQVVEQAVWDNTGAVLPYVQAGRMTVVTENADRTDHRAVATITLDDFVEQAGIDRLDFVKADTEGAEIHVLRGATRTLERFKPKLAFSAYHHDDDIFTLSDYIDSLGLGYRFYLKSSSPVEEETVLFGTAR